MSSPAAAAAESATSPGQGVVPDLQPDPRPAPRLRRVVSQARFDATVWLANGEQLLLTLVLPALVLSGLTRWLPLDLGPGAKVDVVAPGVLALAVMSTAFTGQAIGTAFDRRQGALRLLATTPLGPDGLALGRILAVIAVEAVQGVVLGGLALVLGWRPGLLGCLLGVVALMTGTATFVALGLLLAGTLRSEAVLAAANLLWVLLLVGGGVVVPAQQLGGFGAVAAVLPSGALGSAARTAFQHGRLDLGAMEVLLVWAALGLAGLRRWFRWTD
jgi:ABC-2 type transport system permease protein